MLFAVDTKTLVSSLTFKMHIIFMLNGGMKSKLNVTGSEAYFYQMLFTADTNALVSYLRYKMHLI